MWQAREVAGPLTRIAWMLQAARLLAAGHRVGSYHGRLQPAALELTPAKSVRLRHPEEVPAIPPGPSPYVAPEVYDSVPGHPTQDVYSWGVLIFELLEGRPPYDLETAAQFARGEDSDPLEAPQLRESGGVGLELLVLECLMWEPEDRPSTMFEVERRLTKVLRALRDARKVEPPAPPPPQRSLMRAWTTLSAVAFLPLVILGYHYLSNSALPPDLQVQADYGQIRVWAAPGRIPLGARYRLRTGLRTIGVLPAPEPGTSFLFPTEGEGPFEVELVDGDDILASRLIVKLPPAPGLQITANRDNVEVKLTEDLVRELELRLKPPSGSTRKIPMLEGQNRLRIAWKGNPGVYKVELRDPENGRLITDQVGLLE